MSGFLTVPIIDVCDSVYILFLAASQHIDRSFLSTTGVQV